MVYDAILNGARGIFFFGGSAPTCLNEADAALGWNWTFWDDVLRGLVREIGPKSPLYPALVSRETRFSVRANDTTTQVMSRRGLGTDVWVIAARHGRGTKRVTVSGLPKSVTSGWAYKEGRRVRVRNGTFSDTFPRWGVHVYRFRR